EPRHEQCRRKDQHHRRPKEQLALLRQRDLQLPHSPEHASILPPPPQNHSLLDYDRCATPKSSLIFLDPPHHSPAYFDKSRVKILRSATPYRRVFAPRASENLIRHRGEP